MHILIPPCCEVLQPYSIKVSNNFINWYSYLSDSLMQSKNQWQKKCSNFTTTSDNTFMDHCVHFKLIWVAIMFWLLLSEETNNLKNCLRQIVTVTLSGHRYICSFYCGWAIRLIYNENFNLLCDVIGIESWLYCKYIQETQCRNVEPTLAECENRL